MRALRHRQRGFTLPEILVSLVAGLIIAVAVVGLAKTATTTFHEETRIAGSELALRLASERVRSDIQRAAFMSSPNLRFDPMAARVPGGDGIKSSTVWGMTHLQGVFYQANELATASAGTPAAKLAEVNGLSPDAITLAGNFTGTDEFIGTVTPGASPCTGPRVDLSLDDAAVLRIMRLPSGAANPNAAVHLQQAFQPVVGHNFLARVVDASGRTHFAPACATGITAGRPWVGLQGTDAILFSDQTGGAGGVTGYESVTIAPVQHVRWRLRPAAGVDNVAIGDGGTVGSAKLDLVREWLDATGTVAGTPEIIAEYATDFELSFAVRTSAGAVVSLPYGDARNTDYTRQLADLSTVDVGPHRVRSVRVRLGTRSPIADRDLALGAAPSGFVYRYCLDPERTPCKQFARARTLVTEVGLVNQARVFY